MIENLEALDQELFLALNPLGHPWLDGVMWYISQTATWLPVYFIFAWWIWEKKGPKVLFTSLAAIAVLILLTDQISVHLFKEMFQRYRPTHNLDIGDSVLTVINPSGDEYRGGRFGFVSSHASNIFGIAFFIYLLVKPNWWVWSSLIFLWAVIICYSRIYLGVHYPGDIFVGALLGISLSSLVYFTYRAIGRKYKVAI
jgi:undecaprenyl-diphosphatase